MKLFNDLSSGLTAKKSRDIGDDFADIFTTLPKEWVTGQGQFSVLPCGTVRIEYPQKAAISAQSCRNERATVTKLPFTEKRLLVVLHGVSEMADDTFEFARNNPGCPGVQAKAFVIKSEGDFDVLTRHYLDRYIKSQTYDYPHKVFPNETEALRWLDKYRSDPTSDTRS